MVSRFRMIAGPNGSGKSTLRAWLSREYAVNFYTFLNADDILAEVARTGCCFTPFPVETEEFSQFVSQTTYPTEIIRFFTERKIYLEGDCIRFAKDAVNSYSIALVTAFLQSAHLRRGLSFSQETVFSHPSKLESLEKAKAAGYRTYLYFVSTSHASINVDRVRNRVSQGGHAVPELKIKERYGRSLVQAKMSLPFLSRAFFFDNSGTTMKYLAHWNAEDGWCLQLADSDLPIWFQNLLADNG